MAGNHTFPRSRHESGSTTLPPPQPRKGTPTPTSTPGPSRLPLVPTDFDLPPSSHRHERYRQKRDKASKPIIEWFAKKLGSGRRNTISGTEERRRMVLPIVKEGERGGENSWNGTVRASSKAKGTNRMGLGVKQPQPRNPPSSGNNGISSPHRHHTASSARSQSLSISPSQAKPYTLSSRYPRAATFATRSSTSPLSSPSISRQSSQLSLASSYIDINDPNIDTRSYVGTFATMDHLNSRLSRRADEDASLRPIPPSHPSSPVRSPTASISTSIGPSSARHPFRGSAAFEGRARSGSGSSNTSDRMWRMTGNGSGSVSVTPSGSGSGKASTIPTTVFSVESGMPVMAHIAQVVPQPPPPPAQSTSAPPATDSAIHRSGPSHSTYPTSNTSNHAGPSSHPHTYPSVPPPMMHRTLTRDSALSASPSVSSPLAQQFITYIEPSTPLSPSFSTPPPLHPRNPLLGQAPKHSHPHPRDNPKPDVAPGDNASILTLASSTFAFANGGGQGGSSMRARSFAGTVGTGGSMKSGRLGDVAGWGGDVDEDEGSDEEGDGEGGEDGDEEEEEQPLDPSGIDLATPILSGFAGMETVRLDPSEENDDLGMAITSAHPDRHSYGYSGGVYPKSAFGPASSYYAGDGGRRRSFDENASIKALRRRGSGDSGDSRFSYAVSPSGAMGGNERGNGSIQTGQWYSAVGHRNSVGSAGVHFASGRASDYGEEGAGRGSAVDRRISVGESLSKVQEFGARL